MGEARRMAIAGAQAQEVVEHEREKMRGEVRERNPFAECPKCGAPSAAFKWSWCPGYLASLPPMVPQSCQLAGEHLECQCQACGFPWREKCNDAPRGIVSA